MTQSSCPFTDLLKQLLDSGHAYIAFDTPEQLEAKRVEIPNFQYDARTRMQMRNSLTMAAEEVQQLLDNGRAYIAFDTPEELDRKRQETENFQYDASTRQSMRNSLTLPREEVERLIEERTAARKNKDFATADKIRDDLKARGIILEDTPQGVKWHKA